MCMSVRPPDYPRRKYYSLLIRGNSVALSVTLVSNALVALLVFAFVPHFSDAELNFSSAELKAVMVYSFILFGAFLFILLNFSFYVENNIDKLFEIKERLAKYNETAEQLTLALLNDETAERLALALLNRIFFVHLLLWTIFAEAIAMLLDGASLGVVAVAFMCMGIVTVIIWAILVSLTNLPGKPTYEALLSETHIVKK